MFPLGPIALPFQQSPDSGQPHRASLHHARKRGFLGSRRSRATAIFDDVDVVTCAEHFNRREGDANLRPQTGHEDVLAARGFDGFAETWIVPRVHGVAFDDWLAGEDERNSMNSWDDPGFRK